MEAQDVPAPRLSHSSWALNCPEFCWLNYNASSNAEWLRPGEMMSHWRSMIADVISDWSDIVDYKYHSCEWLKFIKASSVGR